MNVKGIGGKSFKIVDCSVSGALVETTVRCGQATAYTSASPSPKARSQSRDALSVCALHSDHGVTYCVALPLDERAWHYATLIRGSARLVSDNEHLNPRFDAGSTTLPSVSRE